MNSVDTKLDLAPLRDELASRLDRAGVVILACDPTGTLVSAPRAGRWVEQLLHSAPIQQALRRLCAAWKPESQGVCLPALAGVWVSMKPVGTRRSRSGFLVCATVDRSFADSELFSAMCSSAELDRSAVREALAESTIGDGRDAARILDLSVQLVQDHLRDRLHSKDLENIGQKLSDLYEEINLLYSITQSMTVGQQPRKFITMVCGELRQTLPYAWVGVQLLDDAAKIPQVSGELILAEGCRVDPDAIMSLTRELAATAHPDEPQVLNPSQNEEHARFLPLGRSLVVHPIGRQNRMLGVVIAGDKIGADEVVSSVDVKLLQATASHMAIFLENAGLYQDIHTMFLGTLEALTAAIDAKDRYTCGHSQRVAHLASQLASALGFNDEFVQRVRIAGLVHDVGKIGVPEEVLGKAGKLTDAEFAQIKMHPEIGYRILKDIPQLRDVLSGVLHHHERWDGLGYPHNLKGPNIPEFARIIALADSFDAMSSNRTYRAARERSVVLEEILRCAGKQFDPEFAPIFASLDFSEFDRLVAEHRAIDHASLQAREEISS
jgi:HD-GYP domain-containing protein (c-di-GMP phosphodiesterase class II)